MNYLQVCAWVMVVFGGIWAGVILVFAIERTNLWARMPIEQYAVDFRRSLFRVDPMQPILAAIATIAAAIFAWNSSGASGAFAWAGVALIVVVVVSTIAEPINSKFRQVPEGQVPDRAEHYRTIWRKFHFARNLMALASIACLAAAAVVTRH